VYVTHTFLPFRVTKIFLWKQQQQQNENIFMETFFIECKQAQLKNCYSRFLEKMKSIQTKHFYGNIFYRMQASSAKKLLLTISRENEEYSNNNKKQQQQHGTY